MPTPAERIDDLVARTPDWRGDMFVRLRALIHEADPEVIETWKWVSPNRPGTPIFEHTGIVCHINVLKDKVKLTFHEGAVLPDPHHLFNASLEANKTRAIDLYEGDRLNARALKTLIRAAVTHRLAKTKPAARGR